MSKESRVLVDQVVVEALEQAERQAVIPDFGKSSHSNHTDASSPSTSADGVERGRNRHQHQVKETWRVQGGCGKSPTSFVFSPADFTIRRACGVVPLPILHPEAKIRLTWMIVGFVFVTYEAIAIPLHLAFEIEASSVNIFYFYFMQIVSAYWLLDICASFITGYVTEDGSLVTTPGVIARRYLRTWFVLDLIAGFPWDWIASTSSMKLARGLRIMRAIKLLRLVRLLRVLKLKALMEKLETIIEASQIAVFMVGVTRVVFLLYGITHWAACIWYVIGKSTFADGVAETDSWFLHTPVPGLDNEQELNRGRMYIYSIYFALTTMTTVGYGDITPTNFSEVSFTIGLLCCASIVFAGLMGVLMDLISQLQSATHVKQERKAALSRYLRWRAVPRKLTMSIRQHMSFMWDTNEGYDQYEDDIKAQLPPVLKTELCFHVYGRVLRAAPFLAWVKDYHVCVKHLAELVHTLFLVDGDNVFRMGMPNVQVYILISGRVFLSRNEVIEYGEDQDAGGFVIPRNTDKGMSLSNMGRNLAKRMMSRSNSNNQEPGAVSLSPAEDFTSRLATQAADQAAIRKLQAPGGGSGFDIFDSEVLKNATVDLVRSDIEKRNAALLVQRVWRKKIKARRKLLGQAAQTPAVQAPAPSGPKSVSRMRSKLMFAPAYFGESCLWVPYADWREQPPLPYMYTVTAETRSELLDIPRESIEACIEHFSPWLAERFEIFREGVIRGLQQTMEPPAAAGKSCRRPSYVDWAAMDLELPFQDDTGMSVNMRQSLNRVAPVRRSGTWDPQASSARRSGSRDLQASAGAALARGRSGDLSSRRSRPNAGRSPAI
eukprot:TRINITY_DN22317_c0_g3_i1.p1 TRINITY_DN22317_c0_g3~~TRINITY_DN22317_c0_g3_i1.p1  ORF type:complete len:872 (+),score=150.64 TRINITY_DN22317_c0_g3_i1:129-2618(+)